ncbi:fibronectin type III domain-containing protein [uncultured Algoriphagus sp.]|uniref:fibronectin type III domain-containing protein n=1 Tax=uncultured Algoriphagus sp. TaxID=417365 RepID=UPI0025967EEC|nr:fibronectin type III domain-containing protein [uncultured Algoriphagus sp.]
MFKSSTVDVLIIYGQSQAEGTSRKSDLSEDYIRTGKNVYIWNPSTSAVELLNVGADGVAGNHRWPDGEDLDTYFGPELGIMHYWEARYPERELVIFKWAIGGRPLLKGSGLLSDKGCFDPPEEELFRMFKRDWGRFVEFMRSLNHSVRVIGVDRAQGESDTIYTLSNPGEYLAALRREKAEMVEMFNQPDLKMVLMLPNTYNSGEYQVIQEQFDFAISDQNVGIATARQVPVYGADENAISWDGVHFGADIMIYEAFKTMRVLDAMRIGGISAPDAVSGLASTDVQADEISISWTGTDEEYMVVLNGKVQICTDQTSYTFSGLTSGTIYTVRVYSRSLDWQVSYSELQILTPGGSNIFSVMLANAPSEAAAISGYQAMHTLLEANKPTEITNATAGTIGATQLDDYNLPYCLLGDNSVEFADRMGGKDGINLFVEDAQGYVTHYIGMHGAGGSAKLFIHTFPSALIQNLDYSGGWGSAERIDIPGLTNREYEFLQRCAVDSTTGYV